MKKKLWIHILFFGLMTWLIPFVISFMFYKPGGELVISLGLFKSIMILIGGATGLFFLYRLYKNGPLFSHAGLLIGSVWFVLNVIFDMIVLLPLSKMPVGQYWSEIGLRYLLIPLISVTLDRLVRVQRP